MPRLFVAIELPAPSVEKLVRIQPVVTPGLRNVAPEQIHLTLHFLGEADLDSNLEVLETVTALPFELQISGVGRFPEAGNPTVLWAGVTNSTPLKELHSAVGTALSQTGSFQPEARPFCPHITLARCGRETPQRIVDEFLSKHQRFTTSSFEVTGITLFSSTIVDDVPVYKKERWFPLSKE